jgi:transcription elongation factor Elf1
MTTIAAHMVECDQCGARTVVLDGQNVHDALSCKCCNSSTHTHGDETGKTVNETCRSVTVTGNAVIVPALGG